MTSSISVSAGIQESTTCSMGWAKSCWKEMVLSGDWWPELPCVRSWGRRPVQILHVSLKASLRVLGAGYNSEVQLGARVTVTSASQGSILASCPCFCHRSWLKIKYIRLKVKLEKGCLVFRVLGVFAAALLHRSLAEHDSVTASVFATVFSVLAYSNDILGLNSGDFSCRSLKNYQENFKLKT